MPPVEHLAARGQKWISLSSHRSLTSQWSWTSVRREDSLRYTSRAFASRPDTQQFLEKLKREQEAKMHAQENDNRPFILKYVCWLLIQTKAVITLSFPSGNICSPSPLSSFCKLSLPMLERRVMVEVADSLRVSQFRSVVISSCFFFFVRSVFDVVLWPMFDVKCPCQQFSTIYSMFLTSHPSAKKSLSFFNKSNDRSKQVDRYPQLVFSIKTCAREEDNERLIVTIDTYRRASRQVLLLSLRQLAVVQGQFRSSTSKYWLHRYLILIVEQFNLTKSISHFLIEVLN